MGKYIFLHNNAIVRNAYLMIDEYFLIRERTKWQTDNILHICFSHFLVSIYVNSEDPDHTIA